MLDRNASAGTAPERLDGKCPTLSEHFPNRALYTAESHASRHRDRR
jgi:hypothetical protein